MSYDPHAAPDLNVVFKDFEDRITVATAASTELAHQQLIGAPTAAAGANTGAATVLPNATGGVYPITGGDNSKGVRIHANDAVVGRRLIVPISDAGLGIKVYPNTGGTINGAAGDAAITVTVSAMLVCIATNTWVAIYT